jgi:16S rRNA (adenine1518-N6/adenine1519-N6)-dimethyltransferase
MLKNNLKSLIDGENLSELLTELNLNSKARAENLGLYDWITLSDKLENLIEKHS